MVIIVGSRGDIGEIFSFRIRVDNIFGSRDIVERVLQTLLIKFLFTHC